MTTPNERLKLVAGTITIIILAGCVGGIPNGDITGGGEPLDAPEPDTTSSSEIASGEIEIHHIAVGQADSTLIITPDGETILIDTGDWRDDGDEVISYLTDIGVKRIDHLVATHPHADHIGGHDAVIRTYESEYNGIGNIYDAGTTTTSNTFEEYIDAVEATNNEIFTVERGDTLPISDQNVSVTVLNPRDGDRKGDIHKNSVALRVQYNGFGYLTTGDMEKSTEKILVRNTNVTADVYQAGHHGSRTSSSSTFIQAMSPEIAIISSAKDSQYGHPHEETIERFSRYGVSTYWTASHGDIVVSADGSGDIDVGTQKEAPASPEQLPIQTIMSSIQSQPVSGSVVGFPTEVPTL